MFGKQFKNCVQFMFQKTNSTIKRTEYINKAF